MQLRNTLLSICKVNYNFSYFYALIGYGIDGILNVRTFMLKSMHSTSCNALPKFRINAYPFFFFFKLHCSESAGSLQDSVQNNHLQISKGQPNNYIFKLFTQMGRLAIRDCRLVDISGTAVK